VTRATLDSNIYISALAFGGEPKRLLQPILDEVSRILSGEKFSWPPERVNQAVSTIRSIAQVVKSTKTLEVVHADPSDNKIIECAAESLSDVIISGDKHLLRMKSYAGTPIIRVGEFLTHARGR
jgi:putative PIN family toxin of toxin-antitoxin system